MTAASKIRMVISTVVAAWGLDRPNPDSVYVHKIVLIRMKHGGVRALLNVIVLKRNFLESDM